VNLFGNVIYNYLLYVVINYKTMERKAIEIDGCTGLYEITEDGQIFSIRSQRYLKPSQNSYGYIMYSLTTHKNQAHPNGRRTKMFSAHRLVAKHFLGPPPSRWHTDCHHKDHDRRNNHYTNLEWVTHSENILRSYKETDREGWRKGKTFGPHSPETIELMRAAKERRCYADVAGSRREYLSVQDLLDDLGVYRKAFNRSIADNKPYKGMTFGFI
jgi:hypothetical protein